MENTPEGRSRKALLPLHPEILRSVVIAQCESVILRERVSMAQHGHWPHLKIRRHIVVNSSEKTLLFEWEKKILCTAIAIESPPPKSTNREESGLPHFLPQPKT
jgi:hypothetical protein